MHLDDYDDLTDLAMDDHICLMNKDQNVRAFEVLRSRSYLPAIKERDNSYYRVIFSNHALNIKASKKSREFLSKKMGFDVEEYLKTKITEDKINEIQKEISKQFKDED